MISILVWRGVRAPEGRSRAVCGRTPATSAGGERGVRPDGVPPCAGRRLVGGEKPATQTYVRVSGYALPGPAPSGASRVPVSRRRSREWQHEPRANRGALGALAPGLASRPHAPIVRRALGSEKPKKFAAPSLRRCGGRVPQLEAVPERCGGSVAAVRMLRARGSSSSRLAERGKEFASDGRSAAARSEAAPVEVATAAGHAIVAPLRAAPRWSGQRCCDLSTASPSSASDTPSACAIAVTVVQVGLASPRSMRA